MLDEPKLKKEYYNKIEDYNKDFIKFIRSNKFKRPTIKKK